jgi:hypothetical protein
MKYINLNPQDDFVLERVGILVAGEENVGILQQLMAQHVPQSVVLLWTRMGKGFQKYGENLPRVLKIKLGLKLLVNHK